MRGPTLPYPEEATLADLVEAQVDASPDAVAVVGAREQLTYRQLDSRANRLAHELQRHGIGPDVPVAVCAQRSVALTVGLLAILKAGGACLPLDPSHPRPRLAAMLAAAAPRVVLVEGPLRDRLPVGAGTVLALDSDPLPGGRDDRPVRATASDHLAYVLFTSGSTGAPKGVLLHHRGLVNHATAVARLYELSPRDRVCQFCSISFDVSVEEMFPTWASGGTVVLRPDDVPILGPEWLDWLGAAEVTVLNLPTAYWHEWVRDLDRRRVEVPGAVRLVIAGGEKALGAAYATWLRVGGDRVRWLNAYGPAEASVLTTVFEPPRDRPWPADRDPPIGRPIANTTAEVVDEDGRPVPPGAVGELVIGGVGVARGYLGPAALTDAAFVADPDRPGARRYRTGDLVRVLADGELEFVGRVDEQVKVRGFRVEVGEVERALDQHPAVGEAVVVAREHRPGDRRLVAYVVAVPSTAGDGDAPSPAELRRFLADRLPAYMVPSAFVAMGSLPLTPHGKIDRDALPAPGDPRDAAGTAWVAPRTDAERTVAEVVARVLAVDAVGADDDFFDLGGHSLQAVQVVAELRQTLGVEVGVQALLEHPTVARLAAEIERTRVGGASVVERPPRLEPRPREPGQPLPLTLSQEHMWQLEAAADPPGLFNVTAEHRFEGAVDEDALRAALAHLVERHETLRTSFHVHDGIPVQTVAASVPVELAVDDLTDVASGERDSELHRRVAAQDAAPFDLSRAPLLRARLYRLPSGAVLATTFDHLVCDGTSAYVFLSEVAAAYDAYAAGRTPSLRPLAVQYGDFALWQRGWFTDARLEEQLDYWRDKLAGMPLGPALPFDRVPDRPSRRIVVRGFELQPSRYRRVQRLARATGSTVFVVTVAAVQALFARLSGRTDVVLSTTLSGRQHAELDGLIGCFHGVGRLRTDLSGDPTFETAVARARDTVVGLFEHQDVPFVRVRREVLPDMPPGGPALLTAAPTELQFFHTAHDEWTPGTGVVERPGEDRGPNRLFFRGHLHPLVVTFLDDGAHLWGELSYKVDFYDGATIDRLAEALPRLIDAVTDDPRLRLSELPVEAVGTGR